METRPEVRNTLLEVLVQNEQHPIVLAGKSGGAAVALPRSGRILGLFPTESDESLMWVNPQLWIPEDAERLFKRTQWKNFGGDRTWFGPERDLFVQDLSNPGNTYQIPTQIDPGNYSIALTGDSLKFSHSNGLFNHRLRRGCQFEMTKTIHMIPHPLREAGEVRVLQGIDFVGYEQRTELKVASASPEFAVDIWNLIQIPAGGQIIIPTFWETRPRDFFEPTGASSLVVSPKANWFKIDARERHKIAIRAAASTGRMGYHRPLKENLWSLLVRNFMVNPSGEYVDTPWDRPDERGYAVQCYNDDGNLGDFGEMEYHSPAIDGNETKEYIDYSQVWGFRGAEEPIRKICALLLGVEPHQGFSWMLMAG